MAKRGYKLQEFLAHSENVNCLSIGKKTSRLLITGGDDYKVNLWAIGKPTSLMSLCGHTSAVDSVAFDSKEVLVLAGASSGVIKLWDIEEAKMVRAFTGHRSNCSAIEFHPFGEFLASGSNDTNLKIWDIRKKGCIQTYKGHTRGINTIKFTPDGRWVVTGGHDNIVKVWDLTAGKLVHDFKFHEGPIRSLDFHPLEFLLATGSADRTVKFWDLETFELIGSTRPEATGVRSIKFPPDGRTLFCGLDDGLKVYSWEPVVSHDSVDMGWSTLGDLCVNDEKILGCSYYQNSVGIWVSDISQMEPYGVGSAGKKESMEKILNVLNDQSSERIRSGPRRSSSPDYETKEIKNIYVDCGNSTVANKTGSLSTQNVNVTSTGKVGDKSSIVVHSDIGKESSDSGKESITFSKTKPGMLLRPAHVRKTPTKSAETKQSVAAVQSGTLKQSGSDGEKELDAKSVSDSEQLDANDSHIKSITNKFEKTLLPVSPTDEAKSMLLKPPRVQRSPITKYNETRLPVSLDSATLDSKQSTLENSRDIDLPKRLVDDRSSNPSDEDLNDNVHLTKSEKVTVPEEDRDEVKSVESPGGIKGSNSVKVVRGVKVVSGRTRSLVERFERREKVTPSEDKAASVTTIVQNTNAVVEEEPPKTLIPEVSTTPTQVLPVKPDRATNLTTVEPPPVPTRRTRTTPTRVMPVVLGRDATMKTDSPPSVASTRPDRVLPTDESSVTSTRQARSFAVIQNQTTKVKSEETISATNLLSDESPVTSTRQTTVTPMILNQSQSTTTKPDEPPVITRRPLRTSLAQLMPVIATSTHDERPVPLTRSARTSPARVASMKLIQADDMPSCESSVGSSRSARSSSARLMPMRYNQANIPTSDGSHIRSRQRYSPAPAVNDRVTDMTLDEAHITQTQPGYDNLTQTEEPPMSEGDISETLMETHSEFLNTLQSRLTKLQIVRHFWERNDVKGAITALRKLSDHSVQADVISILTDKTEILTLDIFSLLAPVLTGLLGSRTERPVSVSLEMLLKLVAVFGTVVQSTVTAPKGVGVDLHAEERLQICQSCSAELQKVHKILPLLTRRGGLIARKAQELNLVLQTP